MTEESQQFFSDLNEIINIFQMEVDNLAVIVEKRKEEDPELYQYLLRFGESLSRFIQSITQLIKLQTDIIAFLKNNK